MENGKLPVMEMDVSTAAFAPPAQFRQVTRWSQQPDGLFQPVAYTVSGMPKSV